MRLKGCELHIFSVAVKRSVVIQHWNGMREVKGEFVEGKLLKTAGKDKMI